MPKRQRTKKDENIHTHTHSLTTNPIKLSNLSLFLTGMPPPARRGRPWSARTRTPLPCRPRGSSRPLPTAAPRSRIRTCGTIISYKKRKQKFKPKAKVKSQKSRVKSQSHSLYKKKHWAGEEVAQGGGGDGCRGGHTTRQHASCDD